jgi:hypothetical protein
MMINNERETFRFAQLKNNYIEDGKTLIYLLVLLAISYLSIGLTE